MKKFVLFCLLVTVTFGYADDSKISPELRGYKSTKQVRVIVQYAPGTQPAAQANCGGLLGLVDCVVGDLLNIVGQLPLINGVVALVDGTGIVNLSNQSNVVYISSDRQLSTLDVAGPAINAEVAWQSGYIGTGIGVGIVAGGRLHRGAHGFAGEIAVLPLVLNLPLLATVFTILNTAVLAIRIRAENRALAASCDTMMPGRP